MIPVSIVDANYYFDPMTMIQTIGLIASIILPFFNIPLMLRMIKRRSSEDLSLVWAIGVWICLTLMLPAGWTSTDTVFHTFTAVNFTLFSGVVAVAIFFRIKSRKKERQ